MLYWFRHMPAAKIDLSQWTPFIRNDRFRKHFMKFVYLLQIIVILLPFYFSAPFIRMNTFFLIVVAILTYVIHETLHIIVIYKKGDYSITYDGGIFLWINTNAVLSKGRFWVFMSLPFIVLSVVPFILSFFMNGNIKEILQFVCWINTVFSAADIFNSLLIAMKPKKSIFYRGFYRIKEGV